MVSGISQSICIKHKPYAKLFAQNIFSIRETKCSKQQNVCIFTFSDILLEFSSQGVVCFLSFISIFLKGDYTTL